MTEQEKCGGTWSQLSLLGRWIGFWGERGVGSWGLIKKMRECRKHGVSGRSKLGDVPLPPLCAAPPSGWPSSPRRAEPVSQNISELNIGQAC